MIRMISVYIGKLPFEKNIYICKNRLVSFALAFTRLFLFVCVFFVFFPSPFFSTATIDSSVRCHFKTNSWLNSLIDRNNRNSMWVYRLPVWQTGFFKLIDMRYGDGMRHWTIELLKNAWHAFDFHVSIEKRRKKKTTKLLILSSRSYIQIHFDLKTSWQSQWFDNISNKKALRFYIFEQWPTLQIIISLVQINISSGL